MKALLNIVAGLLLLIQSYKAKKEQVDAQAQADAINEDPTDWFNGHFNSGLHKQQSGETNASKTTANSTDSKR